MAQGDRAVCRDQRGVLCGRAGVLGKVCLWGLGLAMLYAISRLSLPLFHHIAGLVSVVLALSVFVVAWSCRGFLDNHYLLFLGIAYLFVGALNLLHLLAAGSMEVIHGFGSGLAGRLGLAARGLESLSLCLAPLWLGRDLKPVRVFAGFLAASAAIVAAVLTWDLPSVRVGVMGPGLTALRQTIDWVSSLLLLGAIALLWRRRAEFDSRVLHLLLGAIMLALGSEAALTFGASTLSQAGVAGDLLKIFSLTLIFQALIDAELKRPYNLLFRTMEQNAAMVRQERELADSLMETAQVMVLVLDPQGRIVRLNEAGARLTGFSPAAVAGRPFWEVFPAPEEAQEVKEAFGRLSAGDSPQACESEWVARDGARRRINWSSTAIAGEDGAVTRVIGTGLDITDQRDAAHRLQRLNALLEKTMRVPAPRSGAETGSRQAVDSLAADLSRELAGLLRWISGYFCALEQSCDQRLDFRGRRHLMQLRQAIRQARERLEALAEHSRLAGATPARREIDLSGLARAVAAELVRRAPERRVEFVIGDRLTATGDPALLRTVLQNLLGTAWTATAAVARARIEFGGWQAPDGGPGFLVRDNRDVSAPGISHGQLRAWQQPQNFGGLAGGDAGLATVRLIIEKHGGRVWAEAAPRQGAAVYFTVDPGGREPAGERAAAQGEEQPNLLNGKS